MHCGPSSVGFVGALGWTVVLITVDCLILAKWNKRCKYLKF